MEANLRARVATAAVGLPLLAWLVIWGPLWSYTVFFLLLTALALHEYFTMALPAKRFEQTVGVVFGLLYAWAVLSIDHGDFSSRLGLLMVLQFSCYLFLSGSLEERLQRLSWALLGGVYIGFLVPHSVLLMRHADGRMWTLFVLLTIMGGDTVAYFAGKYLGRRKLAPALSPAKTVEGAGGYIVGGAVSGFLVAVYFMKEYSSMELLGLALLLTLLGQIGDLFESWLKRVFAVKDSGVLLPGHGGVLDRLDSLIFPAVFATAYVRYFHP